MDIAKFNKELGTKIAMAKSFEKHDNSEVAIKLWIEISEMTINASKDPSLEAPFRHMLITRTEQIFEHIKSLKAPKEVQFIEEEPIPLEDDIQIRESTENINEIKPESDVIQTDLPSSDKTDSSFLKDDDWFEKVDIHPSSNKPISFEEITASKDFKILTPHDPEYVNKAKKASEEMDMSVIKKPEEESADQDGNSDSDKVICFACGALLPPNTKVCKYCGTKLS